MPLVVLGTRLHIKVVTAWQVLARRIQSLGFRGLCGYFRVVFLGNAARTSAGPADEHIQALRLQSAAAEEVHLNG